MVKKCHPSLSRGDWAGSTISVSMSEPGPAAKWPPELLIIRADKAPRPGSLHSSLSLWELQVQTVSGKQSFLSSTWVVSPYGTHLDSCQSFEILLVCFNINVSICSDLGRSPRRSHRLQENKRPKLLAVKKSEQFNDSFKLRNTIK